MSAAKKGTGEGVTEDTAVCIIGEVIVVREPGVELAVALVEGPVAVDKALLIASSPVIVARMELLVALASAGVSSTSGSVDTNTKATFWAPEMLPSDEFEGATWEESAVKTVLLLVEGRSTFGVEAESLSSTSVTLGSEAFWGTA